MQSLFRFPLAGWLLVATAAFVGEAAEIRPEWGEAAGRGVLRYRDGERMVAVSPAEFPSGVGVAFPGEAVRDAGFGRPESTAAGLWFPTARLGALKLEWRVRSVNAGLIERTLVASADADARFRLVFPVEAMDAVEFASFSGVESRKVVYDTMGGGPEFPNQPGQTFPVGWFRLGPEVVGLIADSPGHWENRCQVSIDPPARQLAALTGDGREAYPLTIKYDARDSYRYTMDGWQVLPKGGSRRFTTWVYASPATSHYEAQLAAHLALADAKGWAGSAAAAILRNTSYLLLRRNLMRDEGRFIFISGIGYGWKQWVSDGFWTALGLDEPVATIESCRSVFLNRITYEDNAQYYLIWNALMKRAGGSPNMGVVRQAFGFLRTNEVNGLYVPPPMKGANPPTGFKTYMDVLPYEDGDVPTSNQGFHCGALMAAQELGLQVSDADIERAIQGYRSLYNAGRRFMPTSQRQRDVPGQDTLYGAALTYAVFGRRVLTDEMVLEHVRTSQKLATPYGLRVISQADGSLLPGHSGEYVYGGSWFLCDAANYLLAGAHGMPPAEVDRLLTARIRAEIAHVPAFNESLSTVTGKPHGHVLYSWNSGYAWLRREFRKRLAQSGPDPVEEAVDASLGVRREGGRLVLRSK